MSNNIDLAKFSLITNTGVPGTWSLTGTHEYWPMPVSFVWFRFSAGEKSLEILNSYVVPTMRRKGFRTRSQSEIFSMFSNINRISTEQGSKEGGEDWMRAVGYKELKSGLWSVTRKSFFDATKEKS